MSIKKLAAAAIILAASFNAQADITILGGKLFAADTGHVTATFLGSDAGYTDVVFFDNNGRNLFTGHTSALGTVIDLGVFSAGTELTFRMHVNDTGNNFYTGPASANFDGVYHASALLDAQKSAVLGFEDLQGGGDRDYNDIQMRVTNVSNVSSVPEVSGLSMSIAGLGVIALLMRRRETRKFKA